MNPEFGPKKKRSVIFYYLIVLAVIVAINLFLVPVLNSQKKVTVTYSDFLDMLNGGLVREVQLSDNAIRFTAALPSDSAKQTGAETLGLFETGRIEDPNLISLLYSKKVAFAQLIPEEVSPILSLLLYWVLPLVFFVVIGHFLMKNITKNMGDGGVMSFGKSNAKVYVAAQTGKSFADVAGEDEAKAALQEIVDFLHDPDKYKQIGARLPKGALLVGPPGTGKTLLARAVAGEANVPFFSISGSEFVEMFVGMGAARVRDLFKQAQEKAPCIVFIDEIDAIGGKREGGVGIGGNDEREQTLNQLLTEMDGFDGSKGVVILAATNRPESLDKALLRPGRFDRRIPVELPDLAGREAILRVHAKDVRTEEGLDFRAIALATSGTSGAELANIINEGALLAVKEGRDRVSQRDLEEAIETVLAGYQRKNAVISQKEKEIASYHEIGHALVAAMQKNSAPVHKITIIPRTSGALGYTMQVDEDEHYLMSREELFNKITTLTAGRAAEELVFHQMTSGAANDIEQATKLARTMITRLGMSDQFGMTALSVVQNAYLGGDASLACSEQTAARIDQEVVDLIAKAHGIATEILQRNEPMLHRLAACLLERETITGEEFMQILNEPAPDTAGQDT
ncbi:MAG: ATP-dependent zinc metalloprotease FtsH [Clostridia bacterium]|nr:ATP-dependent zinc metalloprotease FtsH [Clostridia bacterium]